MYKVDKDRLVEKIVYQLPILHVVLDISQDDVGAIVGVFPEELKEMMKMDLR